MRHKNSGRKFDRNTSSRRAMFRNLTANLILHEEIETTDAKAKEIRRTTERLITKARRLGDIAFTAQDKLDDKKRARRLAVERAIAAYIPRFHVKILRGGEEKRVDIVEKVFVDLAKRFSTRPGGYTRIVKLGPRRGDAAPMVKISFVDPALAAEKTEKTEGEAKPAKKAAAKKAAAPKAEKAAK